MYPLSPQTIFSPPLLPTAIFFLSVPRLPWLKYVVLHCVFLFFSFGFFPHPLHKFAWEKKRDQW